MSKKENLSKPSDFEMVFKYPIPRVATPRRKMWDGDAGTAAQNRSHLGCVNKNLCIVIVNTAHA